MTPLNHPYMPYLAVKNRRRSTILLLGMIIWFGKWVPSIEGITVERLMSAINVFTLHGLGYDV